MLYDLHFNKQWHHFPYYNFHKKIKSQINALYTYWQSCMILSFDLQKLFHRDRTYHRGQGHNVHHQSIYYHAENYINLFLVVNWITIESYNWIYFLTNCNFTVKQKINRIGMMSFAYNYSTRIEIGKVAWIH